MTAEERAADQGKLVRSEKGTPFDPNNPGSVLKLLVPVQFGIEDQLLDQGKLVRSESRPPFDPNKQEKAAEAPADPKLANLDGNPDDSEAIEFSFKGRVCKYYNSAENLCAELTEKFGLRYSDLRPYSLWAPLQEADEVWRLVTAKLKLEPLGRSHLYRR